MFCPEKYKELREKDLQLEQFRRSYETVQKEKQFVDQEFLLLKRKYEDLVDSFNRAIGQRNMAQSEARALNAELESVKIDREMMRELLKGLCALFDIVCIHLIAH